MTISIPKLSMRQPVLSARWVLCLGIDADFLAAGHVDSFTESILVMG